MKEAARLTDAWWKEKREQMTITHSKKTLCRSLLIRSR